MLKVSCNCDQNSQDVTMNFIKTVKSERTDAAHIPSLSINAEPTTDKRVAYKLLYPEMLECGRACFVMSAP